MFVRQDEIAVVDVLDGVLGFVLFEDGIVWNALLFGERGHDVGFDELIVGSASGEDDGGGYAGFVLANSFEGTLALFGRWAAVWVGGVGEDGGGGEGRGGFVF